MNTMGSHRRADAPSRGDVVLRLVATLFLLLSVMQFQTGDESVQALLYAGAAVAVFLLASLRDRYAASTR